jgi:hypothetical protein
MWKGEKEGDMKDWPLFMRLEVIRESAADTRGGESLTTAKSNKICRGNLDEQR